MNKNIFHLSHGGWVKYFEGEGFIKLKMFRTLLKKRVY